jgi:hypothetical protein
MLPPRVHRAALALTLLALSGCSTGSTANPTLAPTPTPDTYSFTADVFTVHVPTAWQNKTEDPATVQKVVRTTEGTGILVLIHDVPGQFVNGQNDVQGNIVVLARNESVPDDALETFAGQQRKGVTGLTTPTTTAVDSAVGYVVSYKSDIQGTPGQTEEVLFNHAGKTYDVSLTTSQFAFNKGQEADLMSIIRSWHWTR